VVSAAQREGVTLYAVVLGTASDLQRFRDAQELLDWGFAHYRPMQLGAKGTVVAEAPVRDYLDVTVPAAVSRDTTVAVLDVNGQITRSVSVAAVSAPVDVGQRVGVARFTQGGKIIASIPLVATRRIAAPNPFERIWIGTVRIWRRVFG
jgi:D-alanyl-D-alanine carboxypeptidase (penicillin-binding protein 5/6)